MSEQFLIERAHEYARLSGNMLDFATPLGHGTDGSVWRTGSKTAVKALILEKNYNIELECYQRLKKKRVMSLQGFAVPQLIGNDDRLLIIEMTMVTAPFILDFAKSHLDAPPDFPAETWEEWEQDGRERFGD